MSVAAATAGRISEGSSSSSSGGGGGSSDVAAAAGGLLVVVYNSLAWPRQEWVRVPVAAAAPDARYTVQGEGVRAAAAAGKCNVTLEPSRQAVDI
jgi:hypothetical protein